MMPTSEAAVPSREVEMPEPVASITALPGELAEFVRGYGPGHLGRIRFAWNGKHADEFVDANEDFRASVVEYVRERPGEASAELLADLFKEGASWAREAWCSPHGFEEVAAALLARRGEDALPDFSWGFLQSFDTFGACHHMTLEPILARRLQRAAEDGASVAAPEARPGWEAMRDLFSKLAAGTAREAWGLVAPGTTVSKVSVLPGWRLALAAFWKRLLRRRGRNRSRGPARK
jgi:hypothetical protein